MQKDNIRQVTDLTFHWANTCYSPVVFLTPAFFSRSAFRLTGKRKNRNRSTGTDPSRPDAFGMTLRKGGSSCDRHRLPPMIVRPSSVRRGTLHPARKKPAVCGPDPIKASGRSGYRSGSGRAVRCGKGRGSALFRSWGTGAPYPGSTHCSLSACFRKPRRS